MRCLIILIVLTATTNVSAQRRGGGKGGKDQTNYNAQNHQLRMQSLHRMREDTHRNKLYMDMMRFDRLMSDQLYSQPTHGAMIENPYFQAKGAPPVPSVAKRKPKPKPKLTYTERLDQLELFGGPGADAPTPEPRAPKPTPAGRPFFRFSLDFGF